MEFFGLPDLCFLNNSGTYESYCLKKKIQPNPTSLFNFLSIWLDIKSLLLDSRLKHGSVWVLGFVWCPMWQLWHWSVQSFKCSFNGSRNLQIPRIRWPLTYLNLQFILFLISKKFPYFSAIEQGFLKYAIIWYFL